MRKPTLTLEQLLYILLFALALGVRLTGTGAPLSDFEADHAMRAVEVARGNPTELGTQPGYVLLTGLFFFLMSSTETTARLWPMLAGSALIFLPFLLRDRVGRKAALVIAVGLAFDPGLVALSQTAGGPILAVSFGLLAGALWLNGMTTVAGVLFGLALLSGPVVVAGAVGIAGTAGMIRLLGLFPAEDVETTNEPPATGPHASPVRAGLLAAGGTLLLAGTLFLRYPQGLSAFASALPAYLEGWSTPSGVPITRLLYTFVSYPLPAVLFGIIAIVRAWSSEDETSRVGRALSLWWVIALLFAFVYPARQVADLVWALIPLWGLAGLEIARYLHLTRDDYVPWALAGLVMVMLLSVWTNLGGLIASNATGQLLLLRWLVIGGGVLLAILSAVLVGLGWNKDMALRGLAWGTALSLGLGMFSGIWGWNERQLTTREDVWKPTPGAGEQHLFSQTLSQLSDWTTGRTDSLEIISLVDTPSVRWALRMLPNVRFQTSLNREDLPDAIISPQAQADLSLGSAYRGQDFVWWVFPNWDQWTGAEWLKWWLFHEGTVTHQGLIVWARGDLFPSGETLSEESLFPEIDLTGNEEEFIPEEEILDRDDPLK